MSNDTLITWAGYCTSRSVQIELFGYLDELAALNRSFSDKLSPVEWFNGEIKGDILLDSGLLSEMSLIECIGGFKAVEMEEDEYWISFRKIFPELEPPYRYVLCHNLSVYGMQFHLYDPREEEGPLVSFVFIDCERLHDLHGKVVRIRDGSTRYVGAGLRGESNWNISESHVCLYYYLESWFNDFLGWVKYFFMPDLDCSKSDAICYESVEVDLEFQAGVLGDKEALKRKSFNKLLEDFKTEALRYKASFTR